MSNKKRVLVVAALTVIPLCAIPAAANATTPPMRPQYGNWWI